MKKFFRSALFWTHLAAGIIAGVVIAIMSFTGAALAFEKELIAWAERDIRRVAPPSPDAAPLPFDELARRAREAKPDFSPASIAIDADPSAPLTLAAAGRGAPVYYQNQYTGELIPRGAPGMRAFMGAMFAWHRWLGLEGDQRAAGKAVTGACNLAFAFLAVSGLYLWWPRNWTWKGLRPSTIILANLRGRARDWNWHNAIGFWTAPVLIVLTLTAVPISYAWGNRLVYTLFGEEAPTRPGPPPAPEKPPLAVTPPAPGARPLDADALVARAQGQLDGWEQITLRLPSGTQARRGGAGQPAAGNPAGESRAQARPPRERPDANTAGAAPQPVTLTVREASRWPRTATVQAHFDPYTGDLLRRDEFGDNTPARRFRIWTRFLHTGEALGWPGQLVAGLASLVSLVLCYTGFALTWRRFFCKKKAPPPPVAKTQRPETAKAAG
ncbi:PepSY domain-containing protein [Termitidicoccus mucosus]|uniref:PepSY-associated TM helix domain-containing protein n=3 Tax=Termitidicoccus mucosus TaxID=1184151 RepID=UPI0031844C2E